MTEDVASQTDWIEGCDPVTKDETSQTDWTTILTSLDEWIAIVVTYLMETVFTYPFDTMIEGVASLEY